MRVPRCLLSIPSIELRYISELGHFGCMEDVVPFIKKIALESPLKLFFVTIRGTIIASASFHFEALFTFLKLFSF